MKKLVCLCLLGLFCLAAPLGAQAEDLKVDLSKMTCEEFLEIDEETTLIFVYAWLEGYASAKSGKTVTDLGKFEQEVTALAKMCEDHPKAVVAQSIGK